MYSVKGDRVTIYNDIYPTESAKAINPKLTLKDNAAGTLEITLPVGNTGYDVLERMKSEITVYRDNTEIWSGRIIAEQRDFQNNRILTCEGELAYLNDTTQPPAEYNDYSISDFLMKVLAIHNQKVDDNKKFELGAVEYEESESYDFITNDENTLTVITEQLLNNIGGHLRIRKENGLRYLDYLKAYPGTNSREIRFGRNLIDFTRSWDMTDFATVVLPRGEKTVGDSSELDTYVEIMGARIDADGNPVTDDEIEENVNYGEYGSRYVTNEEAIEAFGWIEAVVDFDDVTDSAELLKKGREYLNEKQFDNLVIEVTAVDLRYLGVTADSIRLLDNVRCISRPHGLDRELPVSELTIQLDKPENSAYVLSSEIRETFTSSAVTKTASQQAIASAVQGALRSARDNATKLINSATRGYVTIGRSRAGAEFIAIASNTSYNPETDRWSEGTKLWKWNVEGLGYSTDGGKSFETAITMDGAIVADYITTGTLKAIKIESDNGNSKWNLHDGTFTMTKGSITLGDGKFSVNDEGYLKAVYGEIGGFVIDTTSIYNTQIKLDSSGLSFRKTEGGTMYEIGSFNTAQTASGVTAKGITMALKHDNDQKGRFIAWAIQKNASSEEYETILAYSTKDTGVTGHKMYGGKLTVTCPIHLNGHDLYTSFAIGDNTYECRGVDLTGYGNRGVILLPIFSGNNEVRIPCTIVNGIICTAVSN